MYDEKEGEHLWCCEHGNSFAFKEERELLL